MTPVIEVGDLIQARRVTPQGVIPLEFTVTTITGDIIGGSPLGDLDPVDGWTFEVCVKGDPGLPTTLSDLSVITRYQPGQPIRIVGPIAGVWQIPGGPVIDPTSVLAWEPYVEES